MTIVYVTTGAWGSGSGTPNSAAQVDGNFYDVDQRIVTLNADLAEGKRIDSVTYTPNSMTFHFTDGTSQVIPLPIATITYVGQWTNGTPYTTGQMISVRGLGMFQVLVSHTTPPLPAVFDLNATLRLELRRRDLCARDRSARGRRTAVPGSRQQGDATGQRRCPLLRLSGHWRCEWHQRQPGDREEPCSDWHHHVCGRRWHRWGGGQPGTFNI